eukprot:c45171_g1_i1 orf=122-340(-)
MPMSPRLGFVLFLQEMANTQAGRHLCTHIIAGPSCSAQNHSGSMKLQSYITRAYCPGTILRFSLFLQKVANT